MPLAEATVEDHLATSSDHFTLSLTFLDIRSTPVQPAKIRVTTEDELKRFVEIVELGATEIPLTDSTHAELDEIASSLTGNTSPGSDNITVNLLQAVWHIIGIHVCRLFEGCLSAGYHPKPFKEAEVVMIAKPGRRDLTEPRAWRPILLLSCLGKGLERLIARRLAWAAVYYSVLHPQQAGALPKRSATDLVTALIHDIEEAFACKKVATLVTMDIQGAFDTVMRNRLVLRLREQGWPDYLARWAGSFMSGRSARVRYQDTITPSSPLQCGLPQGSPVSPILFLLYTKPIYRLGNPWGRFGYADDTAILSVGDTGAANGVSFDPKTTEVMHFSRSKLRTAPAVRHGDVEKHPELALRWLGIWLDSRLLFRVHVEKWAAKAKAVAYHLQGLTNTIHGPLPSAVRGAVRACVEPVLLYGSEAWYPGTNRPRWSQPNKDTPSNELLGQCARPKLIQKRFQQEQMPPLQTASKEKTAEAFLRWVKSLDPLTLVVYSDGSLSEKGVASYGFTIHQDDLPIFDGSGRLGPAEVFDAEATRALEGLKAALNLRESATQN
ncbi:hypothetical protein BFJ69_g18007, partial [Fusarium oxysporum]